MNRQPFLWELQYLLAGLPADGPFPEPECEPSTTTTHDAAALAELRCLGARQGRDFFSDLLRSFFADGRAQLGVMNRSLFGSELPALARAARRLKGGSAILRPRPLMDRCTTLEAHAVAGELEG